MKEEWLFPNAVVPVDVETTAALVAEIKRLIDVIGDMALAQPEQEPVGKFAKFTDNIWREVTDGSAGVPLYTAPQRTWADLPTIVILDVYAEILKEWRGGHQVNGQIAFAKAIEQALKERNT